MHRQNGVCEYYIKYSLSFFNKPVALIESQVVEKYRVCITLFIFAVTLDEKSERR